MFNNSDNRVPVVTNSRYAGHGFTEEGANNDLHGDETVHAHQVYQYYDPNNETFGYSTGTGELERLLSPSDAANPSYYPDDNTSKMNKLNQLYRRSFGFSAPYDASNTPQLADSAASNTYPADFNFRYNTTPQYASNFVRNVQHKGSEMLTSLFNAIKSIFINALGMALGVFLTMLFVSLLYYIFIDDNRINKFKGDYKKKNTPPAPKTEVKKTAPPPPKPELVFEPVYFKDVLGIDEAKEDIMEVVKFIKKPYLYKKVGAKVPKGILLVGAPGTGKTMLAKAVATETGIPFIYTSGPEFIEIYVGQGAQRIRALFQKARSLAPCIIFIDEIDAVGGKRASGSFSGQNREHDQTLNQLLVEMDGFNVSSGITILAATNRMNILDKALLRPGRFDRVVHIPLPSIKGREQILNHYLQKVNYDRNNINVKDLAKITPGYSGADLKNLVNEAALITVKQDRTTVGLSDLYEARDKIIMGNKRNLLMPDMERRMTAYHEAGHALVAYYLYPNTDPIHKATIITRGTALGFVEQLPNDEYDKSSYKLIEMKSRLAVCMAGRLAEKLVFGYDNMTSGASSDIIVATDLAYKMITQYGMSDKLASLNFHNLNTLNSKLSSELNVKIENEIIKLIKEAEHLAESILRTHRKQLELLASELLKYETLTGDQIATLIKTNKALELEPKPVAEGNHSVQDKNTPDGANDYGNNSNETDTGNSSTTNSTDIDSNTSNNNNNINNSNNNNYNDTNNTSNNSNADNNDDATSTPSATHDGSGSDNSNTNNPSDNTRSDDTPTVDGSSVDDTDSDKN
ncbi:metalloprotease/cell division cycle protein [Theileria orientalis]|uniref:Metalloprotease/cell division cycle protein n=1 Tax=Theileria orientalis TaxID=68886 RepID=A0A976MAE2_THEOR|nr:metalloprotease/cell division cycle protein [Theileria orientalis]